MNDLQPVRGTRDLIGEDFRRHAHVIDTARRVSATYGFDEWATPIFEDTRVFSRTLGDTSDVVTKEMYSFQDRGGDSLTLRPEGTAGICRALVTGGLTQSLPQKVFYAGPMFRYERPQKGRYRQFHQIGCELIGPSEPLADAEVIACGWDILKALGISDDVTLELNTLGDAESKLNYRAALVSYFSDHKAQLSEESELRLDRNPMRILDSKDDGDRRLVAHSPTIEPYLSKSAATFYKNLQEKLANFNIYPTINPRIVRGLDYYSHTAFEFVTTALGSQGTVMAGGRYDGLVEEMGGPKVAAVGWAAGIERLSMLCQKTVDAPRSVFIIPHNPSKNLLMPPHPLESQFEGLALEALQELRNAWIRAEISYSGSPKRRMERANKANARFAVFMPSYDAADGEKQNLFGVRDLDDGSQTFVKRDDLIQYIKSRLK